MEEENRIEKLKQLGEEYYDKERLKAIAFCGLIRGQPRNRLPYFIALFCVLILLFNLHKNIPYPVAIPHYILGL